MKRRARVFESEGASLASILGYRDREPRERVRLWLGIHNIRPSDEVLDVLQLCDSGAEVWMVLGFTSLPGFRVELPNRFVADQCSLTIQEPCGKYRIDVVLRCPVYAKPIAIEIDGDAWHRETIQQACRDAAKDRALLEQGYGVFRQNADGVKPFARQLWWTLGNTPQLWGAR